MRVKKQLQRTRKFNNKLSHGSTKTKDPLVRCSSCFFTCPIHGVLYDFHRYPQLSKEDKRTFSVNKENVTHHDLLYIDFFRKRPIDQVQIDAATAADNRIIRKKVLHVPLLDFNRNVCELFGDISNYQSTTIQLSYVVFEIKLSNRTNQILNLSKSFLIKKLSL